MEINKRVAKMVLLEQFAVLNEGRNTECFPVMGFGMKDADLDPEGCSGIKAIESIDDDGVRLEIGGHKTVVPFDSPEFTKKQLEDMNIIVQEIVSGCGYSGEWTGDDWTLNWSDNLDIQWAKDIGGNIDYLVTANRAKAIAQKRLEPFCASMRLVDEAMERESHG